MLSLISNRILQSREVIKGNSMAAHLRTKGYIFHKLNPGTFPR
jgi:hypothetical protein